MFEAIRNLKIFWTKILLFCKLNEFRLKLTMSSISNNWFSNKKFYRTSFLRKYHDKYIRVYILNILVKDTLLK